jgi:pimeloyl-ACP methyl ester carboxylesterase
MAGQKYWNKKHALLKHFTRLMAGFMVLLSWQGCFRFAVSDSKAEKDFAAKNIRVQFKRFNYQPQGVLHYASTGADSLPTLLFIHGSPGSWNAFENYLQDSSLLQHYRMISVDRPGFGSSNFGKALPVEEQARCLLELVKSISNNKPITLVGHSLGGPIAVQMAAMNPAGIERIVLLSASVSPADEPREAWRRIFSNAPLRWFMPGAFRPSNDELLWFKEEVKRMPEALKKVKCEVYLVHGEKDRFVPFGNVVFAQKMLRQASAVYTTAFPQANHFIPWTQFADIRNLLLYIAQHKMD